MLNTKTPKNYYSIKNQKHLQHNNTTPHNRTYKNKYPLIYSNEHIKTIKIKNGKKKVLTDIHKELKNNTLSIKGIINSKKINKTKKVRFPDDLLSPVKSGKKSLQYPKGILVKQKF